MVIGYLDPLGSCRLKGASQEVLSVDIVKMHLNGGEVPRLVGILGQKLIPHENLIARHLFRMFKLVLGSKGQWPRTAHNT